VSPTEMILSSGEGDEEEGGSDELNHCALWADGECYNETPVQWMCADKMLNKRELMRLGCSVWWIKHRRCSLLLSLLKSFIQSADVPSLRHKLLKNWRKQTLLSLETPYVDIQRRSVGMAEKEVVSSYEFSTWIVMSISLTRSWSGKSREKQWYSR
jgi:hypothetical protein